MKILLTGGTGLIGKDVLEGLLLEGHEVVSLNRTLCNINYNQLQEI
jgi:uncharacterized protein YbjT (DUF2867 family)